MGSPGELNNNKTCIHACAALLILAKQWHHPALFISFPHNSWHGALY